MCRKGFLTVVRSENQARSVSVIDKEVEYESKKLVSDLKNLPRFWVDLKAN